MMKQVGKQTLCMVVLAALVAPAMASHTELHETGWFEYVWNEDDTRVLYCDALNYVTIGDESLPAEWATGPYYIHDRPSPDGPGVPGYDSWLAEGGGATWVYQEFNGRPGLQIGYSGLIVEFFDPHPRDPFGDECRNADLVWF